MGYFWNKITRPFTGNLEQRVLRLLNDAHTYRGVKTVCSPTPLQRDLGVDLVVTISRGTDRIVYLQLQPNYKTADISKRFTTANLAIIVANSRTSDELLVKKLREGLDYFCN